MERKAPTMYGRRRNYRGINREKKTHTAVLNKIGFSGINSINLFLDPVLRSGIINCKNISYLQQP